MKAVLISIKPKWCELIASGKKTVEVRKSKPKLETPFKVYIYCTQERRRFSPWSSKVIGEFLCDEIRDARECFIGPSCLTTEEWLKYTNGYKKPVWCWHISDLQIYEKPKPLSEFRRPCDNDLYCEECGMYSENRNRCGNGTLQLARPPQSWCYVEEVHADG